MRKIFKLGVAVSIILTPLIAGAAYFRAGDSYTLRADAVVDDNLYVAGSNLFISGRVEGDIAGLGSAIVISGAVSDDVLLAGGNIDFRGETEGDLRVLGGTVLVSGKIGGDLVVTGGTVTILPEAVIGKDVAVVGGEVFFAGETKGDLLISGGNAEIGGRVGGKAKFIGEEIRIADGASIVGNFIYRTKHADDALISSAAQIGGAVQYEDLGALGRERAREFWAGAFGIAFLTRLLVFLLSAFLIVWLLPKASSSWLERGRAFGKNLLTGFLVLVATPIAAIILCVTVIGSLAGLILLVAYALFIFAALPLTGLLAGDILANLFKNSDLKFSLPNKAIVGTITLSLVSLTPVIGPALFFLIFLASLGALSQEFYTRVWLRRKL